MINIFISKVEKAEEILTDEQKGKLRELMAEKHKKMFTKHLMMKSEDIKEIIEELEL